MTAGPDTAGKRATPDICWEEERIMGFYSRSFVARRMTARSIATRSAVAGMIFLAVGLSTAAAAAIEGALDEAIELFERQEYAEARRVLERLPDNTKNTAEARYYLGRLDLIACEYERAADNFERAIDDEPGSSEYHYWHAVSVMRRAPYRSFLGRMMSAANAVREFRKAVELDPENLRPRMTLFQIMVRSYHMGGVGKEDLARDAETIAGIDSVMGCVARGTLYHLVEKDMDRASAWLEGCLELSPDNRAAAISYADCLWDAGRQAEAVRVLTSFVERAPEDKATRFNLGTRMVLIGSDYSAARTCFETCLNLKSDTGMASQAMVRWCLGLACHLQGDEDRARAEWALVHALDGKFDRVLENSPELEELNSLLGD
jgi:tetratricopeptide (TPR) repeat protein